jgi:RNA polymerase sigma-70 factor (ECF subfamily)
MNHVTEAIWMEFSTPLKQFILSRVSDEALAEDILQDVFLKIHARIDTLKDDTKIQSWIYQITRNAVIDYYRHQKIEVEIPETLPAFDETPQNPAFQQIAAGLKAAILRELPEKYAQALFLTEFQGLTQKELAQKLGISVSGAKSRVQRARQLVKEQLLDCCRFEFDRYGTIIDYHPKTSPACSNLQCKNCS